MNMHKNIRLTPYAQQEIWRLYTQENYRVIDLAKQFQVSRPTVYNVLKKARLQEFTPRQSTNNRFKQPRYGLKRLAKVEKRIQERLKCESKRYNKSYPGEMLHVDTKRLPLLKGQKSTDKREYLFVGIDDYSRELYAAIKPDKSQFSAAHFLLDDVLKPCPYLIECVYSDNGREYKGTDKHAFVKVCYDHKIAQKFTRIARPQTNGKAERVIRTLMKMGHQKEEFIDSVNRQRKLNRFINFYNTVKPHRSLQNATPHEIPETYFNQSKV